MGEFKTPGVYIKEQNAFGNSIVEAETAIPVFIGLTEKALKGTESLLERPVRISSMAERIYVFRRVIAGNSLDRSYRFTIPNRFMV